jgi:hypothetical protein
MLWEVALQSGGESSRSVMLFVRHDPSGYLFWQVLLDGKVVGYFERSNPRALPLPALTQHGSGEARTPSSFLPHSSLPSCFLLLRTSRASYWELFKQGAGLAPPFSV